MTSYEYNHINDVLEDLYEGGKLTEKDFDFLCAITDKADRCDKYAWHELRENPDDLPETIGQYECAVAMKWNDGEITYDVQSDFIVPQDDAVKGYEIIAWKYIEPFEEDE